MKKSISIFWFRQDLRLSDNPGLLEASRLGEILPIYIFDDLSPPPFKMGGASKLYLHHALISLNKLLNNRLNVYLGPAEAVLDRLIKSYKIKNIFWSRCYEPWHIEQDTMLEKKFKELRIEVKVFNSSYLWDPYSIKKKDGSYYKVFGAYKKIACCLETRKPLPSPENLNLLKDISNNTTIDSLKLITQQPWETRLKSYWSCGERAAQNKLDFFLSHRLLGYKTGRNYPGLDQTSKLSVNLHFGEISPHQIWESANKFSQLSEFAEDLDQFLSEMVWREFSCYLMTHFNRLHSDNFQNKFNSFPWEHHEQLLNAWRSGNTGYPIIDAGMRELWQTGYMHNRVRMIAASFLVKNLMMHWHAGRDWFWDCLVDADLANNSASWQWVAGCGADAAPYFRIFNPTTQGVKFDGEGNYTRKFVPELKSLPKKYLFEPWKAPEKILRDSGIVLGFNYPKPIVDLSLSRKKALDAYKKLY